MKIEWNEVTWYSMAFAVVLYVTTFLLGVSFGSLLQIKIDQDFAEQAVIEVSSYQYVNKEFGIAFDPHPLAGKFVQSDNKLSAELTGVIERYEIADGQNVRQAILDLVFDQVSKNRLNSSAYEYVLCDVSYYPWIPSGVNDGPKSQMSISVNSVLSSEYYEEAATTQLLKEYPDGDFYPLELYSRIDDLLANDCSRFSVEGSFIYDPVVAPNRFYFLAASKQGGQAFSWQDGTIRILTD